jgi:hypothetical protein
MFPVFGHSLFTVQYPTEYRTAGGFRIVSNACPDHLISGPTENRTQKVSEKPSIRISDCSVFGGLLYLFVNAHEDKINVQVQTSIISL